MFGFNYEVTKQLNSRRGRGIGSFLMQRKDGISCMSEGVMIALITLGGSGIGSLCGIIISSKLTDYRLKELEKKVDKHNTVIERTFKLEERCALVEKDMRVANHRIEDLEER